MAKGYGKSGGRAVGGGMPSNMRNQFQEMQRQMMEQQQRLDEETVTATVGGGALKITMTGNQVCKNIEIDPDFLKETDAEMFQDILLSGINSALELSKKLQEDRLGSVTGGLSGLGLGF